jgi:hypothetical protein
LAQDRVIYIKPVKKEYWELIEKGHRRSTASAPTLEEALDIAFQEGYSEVRMMNEYGKINRFYYRKQEND